MCASFAGGRAATGRGAGGDRRTAGRAVRLGGWTTRSRPPPRRLALRECNGKLQGGPPRRDRQGRIGGLASISWARVGRVPRRRRTRRRRGNQTAGAHRGRAPVHRRAAPPDRGVEAGRRLASQLTRTVFTLPRQAQPLLEAHPAELPKPNPTPVKLDVLIRQPEGCRPPLRDRPARQPVLTSCPRLLQRAELAPVDSCGSRVR